MPDDTAIPLVIAGRYRLDRAIGRGGMGVVWLGYDEVLGRAVAVKRIGTERAQREAQLAARLQHPHVVAVYDLVDDPAEGPFMVMEYVEGTTLAGLVRERGALPADEAAALLVQIADGLAAATLAGVTHRDVKPSNVLVQADGTAKLSDFGIARAAADETHTQTGMLMGSPAYVAPEVASGGRADHAADVWSFGATAFFLVAGVPPFDTDSPLSTLYRIVHEEPPVPPVTGPLATLIANTMTKDPASRWTIGEVHGFLRDGLQPAAPAPGVPVVPVPAATAPPPAAASIVPVAAPAPRRLAPSPTMAVPVSRRRLSPLLIAGIVAAVVLVTALALALHAASSGSGSKAPAATGSHSSSSSPSASAAAKPTAAGMEAFIRSYVAAVSDNPDAAWTMLTPKFQAESGGLAHYKSFWTSATNGRVLDISADPQDLTVSYHVHFDNFDNGPGPTVLELVYQGGRYLIDGETTKGFTPSSG